MKAHLEYDQAELERQFNPELAEPDFLEHLNRYAAASDQANAILFVRVALSLKAPDEFGRR